MGLSILAPVGAARAQVSPPLEGVPVLAFYPFDGNALDASGNGHHGTVSGPTLTAAGYEGQAYAFDGLNDFIGAAVNINPAVTPRLTMGAWVKAANSSPNRQVISHDNAGYDRSLGIDHRGRGRGWSAFSGSGGVLGYEPVVLDAWTFVAVVYDQPARTVSLYVQDVATGNLDSYHETGSLSGGSNSIRIGSNPRFGEYFSGVIDNAFVLSAAMNREQVEAIRAGGAYALAQLTPGASIDGRVLLDAGPVAGALVQVCNNATQVCAVVPSGADGTYRAEGLSAGTYQITAFPPSGLTRVLSGRAGPIPLSLGEERVGVDVHLRRLCCLIPDTVTITSRYTRDGYPVVNWRDTLVLTADACAGGIAWYEIVDPFEPGVVFSEGTMAEITPGHYQAFVPPLVPNHGWAHARLRVECPDGSVEEYEFLFYIDPSGNVRTTEGEAVEGATVTLYRSDTAAGPFEVVPDGSAIMAPNNRTNPDLTDPTGHFGWDVLAGYYFVRAEKAGCTSPVDPGVAHVDSRIMAIPPPVTDLDLRLLCPVGDAAPVAGDDTAATDEDTILVIPVATLLANDSDPDGDPLEVVAVASTADTHGGVSLEAGDVTYIPAADYNGAAQFTYTVADGRGGTASATVTVTVRPVDDFPFVGSTIAAGNEYSCGIVGGIGGGVGGGIGGGAVTCWGNNGSGQLGDGTTTRRLSPVGVSGIGDAVVLAAGRSHACALRADGTVACWGANDAGQLGDGTTTRRLTPVPVAGVTEAVGIAAGERHSCALLEDATLKCWGDNANGQLGDGTQARRSTPVAVTGLAGATAIAAGNNTTCAVAGGGVQCWGNNSNGQLGNATTTNSPVPVSASGLSDAVQVDVGLRHACAVMAGGGVRCWGANGTGALGDGTTTQRTTPVEVAGITDATGVSVGSDFSCARRADGTARCWGSNNVGQVGDDTSANRLVPVPVAGMGDVFEIAAGYNHVVAVLGGGTAVAWGGNGQGQLGNGTTANSRVPTPTSGIPGPPVE